ncbi:MAG: LacI family transcriptional regulator [Bacteroidetes bacterium]|nr:MAG: LacI family transcriptional regulator [Bacteroidota bacterium]
MKKVSIGTIAERLKVSKTLVSLVLNDKGDQFGISKKTQEAVRKLAEQLDYQPSRMARGLRTGRSKIIGLIVADIANPFYSRIARSIENIAERSGYHLMVCSSDEIPERELQLIRLLKDSQGADGIILSTTQDSAAPLLPLRKAGYPLVLIDRDLPKMDKGCVLVDNRKGAYDAVSLLMKSGQRRTAMLTIGPSHLSSINERLEGYKDALKKFSVKFDKNLVKEIAFERIRDEVYQAMHELLSPAVDAQAIFTANNHLAVAAMEAVRRMGKRIPDDVALVSFDDVDLFRLSDPPVTAIAQPMQDIGEKAMELLLEMIEKPKNKAENKRIVLPTTLVLRESSLKKK